ncbi:protein-L-isoaspartate O-methyltransferase, partial [Enterococcus hirae]
MKSRHKQGMQQMLDEIEQEVRYTRRWIGKEALDSRVMDAMARVPRDAFVPADM